MSSRVQHPKWILILPRVLVVTFLSILLSFAVLLLLSILGLVLTAWLRSENANLSFAYRDIALPGAAVVGIIVLVATSFVEIRHYHQTKTLAQIERSSG